VSFCISQASTALTCVENIECTEDDATTYQILQTNVGIAEANDYMCTDADARKGTATLL